MPRIPAPQSPEDTQRMILEDIRKIYAFASSAGRTIPNRDALEVIKSICVARLHGDKRAAAIARHADAVRAALEAGAGACERG